MKPLDIGFVVTSISRKAGGLFTSVRRIAQTLHAMGHTVTVYAVRDEFSEKDLAAWLPLQPLLFDRWGPEVLGFAPALSKAIGEHDILHQHGIWQFPSYAVNQWRKRTGKPVIIAPRGMLDTWAIRHRQWKKRLAGAFYEHANIERAACIQALAKAEAKAIRAAGYRNPIAQISNGIDLPEAPIAPPQDSGRKTLLFLGRLHPKKGVTELLMAWDKLAKLDPEMMARWRIVIGGWGDSKYLRQLAKQIAVLPEAAQIELCGPLHGQQKMSAFLQADAFILPSYSEGQPIAVLEAWANNIPTFITEDCNLPKALEVDAAVRITTDPEDLARVLHIRLEDSSLAAMASRARLLCEEEFTCERVAEQYLATYHWLLGQGECPNFVSMES